MNASAPLVHLGPQVPPAHCAARPVMVAAQCAGPSCGLGGRARNQYKTVHHVSEHPFTLNPVQTGRLGWGVIVGRNLESEIPSNSPLLGSHRVRGYPPP